LLAPAKEMAKSEPDQVFIAISRWEN